MSFVIELHDEPLTTEDPVAKGDGRHLVRELPDDTGIYVHVKDGTITGYSAINMQIKIHHVYVMVDGEVRPMTFLSYTTGNGEVGWRI
jgi:ABC-type lipopolysaccharide export system ATPase subunit